LKELLEEAAETTLGELIQEIGRSTHTGEDNVFFLDPAAAHTRRLTPCVPLVVGEDVRDYAINSTLVALFPYNETSGEPIEPPRELSRHFWSFRTTLRARLDFGQRPEERGLRWFDHSMFFRDRFRTPLSIAFAFVATHNHFVLDRGGKVFKQSAPVIKLPPDANEDDHLVLLGLLNSSVACFWMKQVFYPKATAVGDVSTEKGRPEANRYEFAGTGLESFPLPSAIPAAVRSLASMLDRLAAERAAVEPRAILEKWATAETPLADMLREAARLSDRLRGKMVALQEELDWACYRAYRLLPEGTDLDGRQDEQVTIDPAHRPTFWAGADAPESLEPALRGRYERRRVAIDAIPSIGLIETSVFKRLWLGQQGVFGHSTGDYAVRSQRALAEWLLDRLEDARYWPEVALTSCGRLGDAARRDAEFTQVAELYRGRPDFDVHALVAELVESEAVPFLPVLRYKASGLEKRRVWERTWELQRQEDAIDARTALPDAHPLRLSEVEAKALKAREVGGIAAPPRYTSADFLSGPAWRLRGKLDVPKERFIIYPHCARAADPSVVVAWAGWDHLQQARALAAYYMRMKTDEGWSAERLTPLLAGLRELVPWLRQWHNDLDPEFDARMGDYFADFVTQEAHALGLAPEQIAAWTPSAGATKRTRPRRSSRRQTNELPSR
jgi:hypothetical protein